MKKYTQKFTVKYCKNPMPETLRAEKHTKFLRHLARGIKRREAKQGRTSIIASHLEFIKYNRTSSKHEKGTNNGLRKI